MTSEPPDNERPPDDEWLYVPLRETACGVCLRLFRDRDGARCAVGFTSEQRLASVLGPRQPFYRLPEHAVRALAAEREVSALVVDPGLVAAPVGPQVELPVMAEGARRPAPAAVGVSTLTPVLAPALVTAAAMASAVNSVGSPAPASVGAPVRTPAPALALATASAANSVGSPIPTSASAPALDSTAPPAPTSALTAARARIRSARASWAPETTGVLAISAVGGAAALLMQVLG